jgi:dihydroorotase
MRRALEYVKAFDGIIAQHAQDPRLTEGAQMHEGTVSAQLGLPGWPAVAEEAIIARDVLLAEHVGSRLHVCHVSTAGSVDLIRWAKARGIRVTAEVTPHHLILTDEEVRSFDPVFKVNPPLRTDEDVRALREGLADGTIDVVGTDHAPHPAEHKCVEWTAAAMGMVGLESAMAVVTHAMADHDFSHQDLARVMSERPAAIMGLDHHGSLARGTGANVVLVDPSAAHVVDPETHQTMGRNNPFRGRTLGARVTDTFLFGTRVYADGTPGEPLAFGEAGPWND